MKRNKLLNLLRTLTSKEFKELADYAKSPFFIKKRQDIPLFHTVLKKYYPFQNIETIKKETLFEGVYGKKATFNDKKFRQLQSDFVKIIENYLLFLENEADRFEKEKRLVTIYGKRNAYDEFSKNTTKLLNQLEVLQYQDASSFKESYYLKSEFYFHPRTENRTETKYLIEALKDFESFFVLERAKLGIDLKNMEKMYSNSYEFEVNNFSNIIPKNNESYILFEIAFKLLKKRESSTYLKLKAIYVREVDNLSPKNKLLFFSVLQNFASQQLRIYEKEFLPYIIELYKLALDKKVIFNNGKIHDTLFINIIILNLKAEEYDWVEQAIIEYKDSIAGKQPKLTIKLAKAYLKFQKENYPDVIQFINEEKLLNIINNLRLKTLVIRAFFKIFLLNKTYLKSLNNKCLSFEKYLSRNDEIVNQKKTANLNFSKTIRKISNLLDDNKWDSKIKSEVILEVNQMQLISYKSWILGQIKVLN